MTLIAAIRIRGGVHLKPDTKKTLELLGLGKNNSMVLVADRPETRGMLSKAQSFIACGEIDQETLETLLRKRGKKTRDAANAETGTKPKGKNAEAESFDKLAAQLLAGKKPEEIGIQNFFRLKAPRKGFERLGIKQAFVIGGASGNRGTEINALLKRMV